MRHLSHLKVLGATFVAPKGIRCDIPNGIRCDIFILGATLSHRIPLNISEIFSHPDEYLVRHVAPNKGLGATIRCDMSHLIPFRTQYVNL